MTRTLCILLSLILPLAAQEILRSAAEVVGYPENDPEHQPLVSLEATVTYIDTSGTVFLADMTGATFLSRVKKPSLFKPGQVLSVEGTRLPGLFIGGIIPSKTEVVGNTPLPPPRSVTLRDLSSGKYHYQLVAIEGIGRSVERIDEAAAILKLSVPGGEVEVRFDLAPAEVEDFIDAKVRAEGLAAGGINDRRQLVSPYLKATSAGAVTVLKKAAEDAPIVGIGSLTAQPAGPSHRVAVEGVALSPELGRSIFMRGGTGAIRVKVGRRKIEPGTRLLATGFPTMEGFSPVLDDASVKALGEKEEIVPVEVTEKNITSGKLDSDLVTLEATLVSTNPYVVKANGHEIQLRPHNGKTKFPPPGSKLRLTGIWQVTGTTLSGYNSKPSSFELWLRSPEDIRVVSAPPWWTPQRLGILLAVISVAGLFALAWAAMLRIQVSKQVRLIEAKTQYEAVAEERQRIAREFHDTLEQELAGLSIRLDAALPRVPDEKASGLLTQLRTLLIRMQTETRDFILDLRETHPAPLSESLRSLVNHLQTTTDIQLNLKMENLPDVPPHTCHHILRITREAINNAIKHSAATAIEISLIAKVLTIIDHGSGFDPATADATRFGLQGMRERAKKIGATLDTSSTPGKGTTVTLRLPLS